MRTRTRNPNPLGIVFLPIALLASITGLIMLLALGASRAVADNYEKNGELVIDTTVGVETSDASVIKADVAARNGVIHDTDTALIPKS